MDWNRLRLVRLVKLFSFSGLAVQRFQLALNSDGWNCWTHCSTVINHFKQKTALEKCSIHAVLQISQDRFRLVESDHERLLNRDDIFLLHFFQPPFTYVNYLPDTATSSSLRTDSGTEGLSHLATFLCRFFSTRFDSPLPPLSAPAGSPRMPPN